MFWWPMPGQVEVPRSEVNLSHGVVTIHQTLVTRRWQILLDNIKFFWNMEFFFKGFTCNLFWNRKLTSQYRKVSLTVCLQNDGLRLCYRCLPKSDIDWNIKKQIVGYISFYSETKTYLTISERENRNTKVKIYLFLLLKDASSLLSRTFLSKMNFKIIKNNM